MKGDTDSGSRVYAICRALYTFDEKDLRWLLLLYSPSCSARNANFFESGLLVDLRLDPGTAVPGVNRFVERRGFLSVNNFRGCIHKSRPDLRQKIFSIRDPTSRKLYVTCYLKINRKTLRKATHAQPGHTQCLLLCFYDNSETLWQILQ